MDSLGDCITLGAFKRALKGLTGDLDQMYSKSLERMEQALRPAHRQILKKLLLWVAWGERPLSILELGHALAIHPGIEDVDEEDVFPVREITTWSAGLLFIDSEDLVRVIHPTTSRFFVERRAELYPKGEGIIAHDCLHYLNMEVLKEPFSDYAVLHSLKHVARSSEKDDDNRASIEANASALHIATYLGLTDVISALIDEGEDLDDQDVFGATPLMYAASRGSTALIRAVSAEAESIVVRLVREPDINVNAVPSDPMGKSSPALVHAVKSSNMTILKKLTARKDIDVDQTDDGRPGGLTPLHIAVMWRNVPALTHLLNHKDTKVIIHAVEQDWSPLYYAANRGFIECLTLLLDHGADLHYQDSYKGNVLIRAVNEDQQEAVELLVQRGIDVKHRDFLGRTALHSAACNRSWRTKEYFLKHVPDIEISAQVNAGETPLHDSCGGGDPHGVRLLVDAGARCDLKNNDGRTPVDMATLTKRPDMLEILKNATGYENTVGVRIKKTLLEAVVSDPVEVLQLRLETVTLDELNKPQAFDGTPLHEACLQGRADIVEMLLVAGANTEATNSFNRTPIFMAIEFGHTDCVRALLAHGADVDKSPFADSTLWEHAWTYEHRDVALVLIEHGARVDKGSRYLQGVLHQAAFDDDAVVVRRLVEIGASVHQKIDGYTAIHRAESQDAKGVLEFFASLDA
ncbi:hypothetical protein ACHAQH_004994 [Verticillium albo-atrum]